VDAAGFRAAFLQSQLGQLWSDPAMKPFRDDVRLGNALDGDVRTKVRRLYPDFGKNGHYEGKTMLALLKRDEEQFMAALKEAVGPFLFQPKMSDKEIAKVLDREPVSFVAERYYKSLNAEDVAYELGQSPAEFRGMVKGNPRLREIGLGALIFNDALTAWLFAMNRNWMFVIAVLASVGFGAALGGLMEITLIRPLYVRPIYQLMLTLGLTSMGQTDDEPLAPISPERIVATTSSIVSVPRSRSGVMRISSEVSPASRS